MAIGECLFLKLPSRAKRGILGFWQRTRVIGATALYAILGKKR